MFKRSIALLVAAVVLLTIASHPMVARASGKEPFSDIAGHWAEPLIQQAVETGYVNGYPDGTFRPEAPVTRAELVKMAAAAGRLPAATFKGESLFQDVAGHWVVEQGYLARAWEYGVVDTSDGSTFAPDLPATRIFTAVTLMRLLGRQGGIADLAQADLPYTDTADLPGWARGWVKQAALDNIMNGYPDGSFRADRPVTRAEAVAVVQRTLGVMTAGLDPNLRLSVDGKDVTPAVPLAVRDGYVFAPASAVYGGIPYTRVYPWPTGTGVAPGSAAFYGMARWEFVVGAAHYLERKSDRQPSDGLDAKPLVAAPYRIYSQVMLPLAPAGAAGSLPYLTAIHDAAGGVLRLTREAGWPGDSLPDKVASAALCAYPYANGPLLAGEDNGIMTPQFCDVAGNSLWPVNPVSFTVSVDPAGPLRLRQAPGEPLVTELQVSSDGSKARVVVEAGPTAVPEGDFRITYTAPGGRTAFNTITVSDHRPYRLLFDPVPTGAAGQPVTVSMRLLDRYDRVVPATTEGGPSLIVTDPDGNPVEAVPKTFSGSRGLERWILTNGVATFTMTPPKAGTYHLAAQLHLTPELPDFDAAAEMTVQ